MAKLEWKPVDHHGRSQFEAEIPEADREKCGGAVKLVALPRGGPSWQAMACDAGERRLWHGTSDGAGDSLGSSEAAQQRAQAWYDEQLAQPVG